MKYKLVNLWQVRIKYLTILFMCTKSMTKDLTDLGEIHNLDT